MSRLWGMVLVVFGLVVAACADAGSLSGAGSEPVELVSRSAAEVSDEELEGWHLNDGCEGYAEMPSVVREVVDYGQTLVVENATAVERVLQNPESVSGNKLVITADHVDRVLVSGGPSLGVGIHSDLVPVLSEALGAGADMIVLQSEDWNSPGEPLAMRALLVVLGDGRVAWTGSCGRDITREINAFLAGWAAPERRAVVEGLFSADEELLAEMEAWLVEYRAATTTTTLAWVDLPPDRRSVDVEDTPAEVLERLGLVRVYFDLPEGWKGWSVTFCGISELGWLGCVSSDVGSTFADMLLEPGSGFEVVLADGRARFGSQMESLLVVDAGLVDSVIDSDDSLYLTPAGTFDRLSDLRAAALEGPVFDLEVLDDEEAFRRLVPDGEAVETDE